ncbi:UDP-N-acetylmuramate: L-alanyl-gamma-D-glutamyl-meso-diaminopimelate ligase [Filimonas lacunae]|uniref:UDP-N-acetylmuramate: L-alanyl-gamma-D-glutamyl-meso-diaminopimelate ligase n=1 Tax=Filimonas lacunae TaxID=477680 RepID=A0A1N7RCF5_9BACT|nr:Mur ligase family protein [Filimonas lacunae]SIT32729.1 UDP-N-acetylmuramate: L-alanyl-gamma-D-glutamyl-meso-diaminopimelate ligase [Filimonas lacunae]
MRVHFISIGGSVMHQLAIALRQKGYQVTGTDDEIFEPAKSNLEKAGLLPLKIGWQEDMITADLDAVILGMHAKADNPELVKARELGLKIYSFPEYIYQESKQKKRVIVGGSHGKTTTTSMIMHVLQQQHQAFDYLVGAKLDGFAQSVNITDAPVIVCEGDEYPASALEKRPKFHFLFPHVAILTGIAWDHINVFPTFDIYLEQFRIFIDKIEKDGILIYNETDPVLKELVNSHHRTDIRYQPYGVPAHTIENGKTRIQLEGVEGDMQVFGNHNLMNLNAAWYACKELGMQAADFVKAISNFKGAAKRLELMAAGKTVNVYRDFAHAPSKVKATIEAVKQQYPTRALYAVLELHTYSSLNEQFMQEYKGAMDKADHAVVFYSKHALELKRMPDLPADIVKAGFAKEGLQVFTDKDLLWQWLQQQTYTNASVLFMSSGVYDGLDITGFAAGIVD